MMQSLFLSRAPLLTVRRSTLTSRQVRFASVATSQLRFKSTRAGSLPEYKGRIPKPEAVVDQSALVDEALGPHAVPLPPPKPEPTKEQKYKEAARRYLLVMCLSPVAIVLSYYLYRRLFLGEERKKLSLVNEATE